jgi:general stress protein 26
MRCPSIDDGSRPHAARRADGHSPDAPTRRGLAMSLVGLAGLNVESYTKGDTMTAPRTILDARFSETGAEPTDWGFTLGALESAELFWLSTVRTDGRPHVTPLVAVWAEDRLHLCTGPQEQKALNLQHNRQVVLTTGCNTWDGGLDVMVEGRAVQVTDQNTLRRLAEAWMTKWDGRWRFEVGEDSFLNPGGHGRALVFAVKPDKVLAFGKGKFTQTSYRF